VNNLNLKNILKSLKLHESTISTVLGAIVVIVLGVTIINYFKTDKPDLTVPGATTEHGQPKLVTGEGSVDYIVGMNESLWDIAEAQYGSGYNWVDIAKANNLVNPDLLIEGQVLTIPDVETKLATIEETTDVVEAISGATYTVETGDNLWDIAVRAYGDGYKWVDIASDNNLTNPDIIHVGNILTLPR